jgi:hypothetical protein
MKICRVDDIAGRICGHFLPCPDHPGTSPMARGALAARGAGVVQVSFGRSSADALRRLDEIARRLGLSRSATIVRLAREYPMPRART